MCDQRLGNSQLKQTKNPATRNSKETTKAKKSIWNHDDCAILHKQKKYFFKKGDCGVGRVGAVRLRIAYAYMQAYICYGNVSW